MREKRKGDYARFVLEDHHEDARELPRPPPLVLRIHLLDALADLALVLDDLFDSGPAVVILRHLRMPVRHLVRVIDVRVDAALEDVGKVHRFGQRLVKVA